MSADILTTAQAEVKSAQEAVIRTQSIWEQQKREAAAAYKEARKLEKAHNEARQMLARKADVLEVVERLAKA